MGRLRDNRTKIEKSRNCLFEYLYDKIILLYFIIKSVLLFTYSSQINKNSRKKIKLSPSLPPIVWKKNSVGVNPVKKLFATKPFAAGSLECISKWGSDLCKNPFGIREPLRVCWPTHAIIWDILMTEPYSIQIYIRS